MSIRGLGEGMRVLPVCLSAAICWVLALPAASAPWQESDAPSTPAQRAQAAEQEVVIKRDAVKLTDPRSYRASMHLEAERSLVLTAAVDGHVRSVSAKPQQKVSQQAEVIRLDDSRAALLLKRAKANLQAAQIEKKLAESKSVPDEIALATARLEAAQADVELAQLEVDQLIIRAPFAGVIERVLVVEGQFVRAGERLATLVDASKLVVEVPVERSAATPGGSIEIKIEETAVSAKVESILPLNPRFDALRELTISPASAIVSIDNTAGTFAAGQTVYSDLIPLAPVTLVPSVSIGNQPDGNRKLQVLRDNVVRDLTVRILGKVGTDSVFVSGRFNEGDEVIVSSTRALADGTPLRALVASSAAPGKGAAPRSGSGATPQGGGARKPASF